MGAAKGRDARPDEELLDACRNGDNEAFSVLWERHRGSGIVASRSIAPALDADDVVSEAYLRVLELVRRGRGPTGAFRPYLYRVIHTVATTHNRSPEDPTEDLDHVPDADASAPWQDETFDRRAVTEAFDSLSPRWQAALWYTEVEGLPPRKASPLLGISPNSVSALAKRARDALKSAWIEQHARRDGLDARCMFTLEHLQRHQLGSLTARATREVESHLETCSSCAGTAGMFATLNRQLGLTLGLALLGGSGAAALLGTLGHGAVGVEQAGASGASGTASTASSSSASAASSAASAVGGTLASIGAPAAIVGGVALTAVAAGVAAVLAITLAGAPSVTAVDRSADTSATADPDGSAPARPASETDRAADSGDEKQPLAAADSRDDAIAVGDPVRTPIPPVAELLPEEPPKKEPPGAGTTPEEPSQPVDELLREDYTPGFECYLAGQGLIGTADRYGLLRLRGTVPDGSPLEIIHPSYDPAHEGDPGNVFSGGVFTDPQGNVFDFGFFTGTDPEPQPGWYGQDPELFPAWGTLFAGYSIDEVALEIQLVAPDGTHSPWTPVDANLSCI